MRNMTEAQSLAEGNEILLSPNTGESGIVEDIRPARWSGPGMSGRTHVVVMLTAVLYLIGFNLFCLILGLVSNAVERSITKGS